MAARGGKVREVVDEFRSIVLRRGGILDVVLPPLTFLGVRALSGEQLAMAASLAVGVVLVIGRAVRHDSMALALLGLAATGLAYAAASWLKRADLFFLPDLITNVALALICIVSAAMRRPLVAWTSHLMRRWPRAWYWHPRVLPAYSEVTLAWAVFFLLQAGVQWSLFLRQDVGLIAVSSLLNGWPATVVLLVLSYLYGTWRLAKLRGPSVAEFVEGAPGPWTGQRRGF